MEAEDRARLVELLLESLHSSVSEIEAAWDQEIEERASPPSIAEKCRTMRLRMSSLKLGACIGEARQVHST